MGFLDFFRRENRQSAPYTDAIVAQIIRSANQVVTSPAATAAVEAAAGIVSRAFALATVRGADLPPEVLSFIAREMIVRGECVLLNEGGDLVPVSSYEVRGVMPNFDSWIYRIEVTSPGGNVMAVDPALRSRVFHARYSYDAARPWVGVGPLQRAVVTGELAPRIEASLRSELNAKVGYLLSTPLDPSHPSMTKLKSDLEVLDGQIAMIQSPSIDWQSGSPLPPGQRQAFVAQRIGADPPSVMVQLYSAIQTAVLAVCGVPAELVLQSLEGTGQREAWRRCLHGTIQPLGAIVGHSLSAMYMRPVSLDFEAIFASDIQGRARSFQSMAAGGMDLAKAAALSGLMSHD